MDFPGFPCNNFDFHFEEVGPALAGLIVRDLEGIPRAGLLSSRPDILSTRSDWFLDAFPFVAVRVKGRSVLLGGTTENSQVAIVPAPSANARIDVIWTRPADVDAGEDIIPLSVTTGLAAAVPAKPAIPAGAIEVGVLRVPAEATGTSGAVLTLTFPHTVTAGGILPFRSTAERNAFAAVPGQLCVIGAVLYKRVASAWEVLFTEPSPEYRVELAVRSIPANSVDTRAVVFPTGLFSATPKVAQATPRSQSLGAAATVNNLTKNGCDVHYMNLRSPAINMGVYLTVSA